MGLPSRTKPSLHIGISEGRGLVKERSAGGMYKRHLLRLRCRPREGPSASMMERALSKSAGGPHSVPSSRYQQLIRSPGTSCLIRLIIGFRARAKPRGPKGSPWWTPQQLEIWQSPKKRGDLMLIITITPVLLLL